MAINKVIDKISAISFLLLMFVLSIGAIYSAFNVGIYLGVIVVLGIVFFFTYLVKEDMLEMIQCLKITKPTRRVRGR